MNVGLKSFSSQIKFNSYSIAVFQQDVLILASVTNGFSFTLDLVISLKSLFLSFLNSLSIILTFSFSSFYILLPFHFLITKQAINEVLQHFYFFIFLYLYFLIFMPIYISDFILVFVNY